MQSKLYISHKQKRTDLILEFWIYSGGYCYGLTYLFGRPHFSLDLSQQRKFAQHRCTTFVFQLRFKLSSSYWAKAAGIDWWNGPSNGNRPNNFFKPAHDSQNVAMVVVKHREMSLLFFFFAFYSVHESLGSRFGSRKALAKKAICSTLQ